MALSGLDFETFSDVDIKTHGMDRYMESPNFTVLCAAVSYPNGHIEYFDFVTDMTARRRFDDAITMNSRFAAHNASFERAVLKKLGYNPYAIVIKDSAVIARAVGAGSKLEAAAPQLLDEKKIELGAGLIRIFSVPTKGNNGLPYTKQMLEADADLMKQWKEFLIYCGVDADLSRKIVERYEVNVPQVESRFELTTQDLNDRGWFVDMDLVYAMQDLYKMNLAELELDFQRRYDPNKTLNFRSYKQLQTWCAARGVKAKSFDQTNLPKLIDRIEKRVVIEPDPAKYKQLNEVLEMLRVKRERGGSSLTKLQTIIDMTSADGRLRNQYLHVGAGQTYRTSGRGVQLQNLARLGEEIGDVDEVVQGTGLVWDNDKLAHNIRQVFRAEHPEGLLVVGDFKSVESRGLAMLAGEDWKIEAYLQKRDIYKQLATTYSSFGGVAYEDVTKAQRQGGKVGELACGYGAGGPAVQGFAEKMGIFMTDSEAQQIVTDWRGACPATVQLWRRLDAMMHSAIKGAAASYDIPGGGDVVIQPFTTPTSLRDQHPGAQSIELVVFDPAGAPWLRRVFHGCYYRGRDVCYYRPSELKGGDLWRGKMTTPPHQWYRLYGGKLAGILTQSFCRELFMHSLWALNTWSNAHPNVKVIGQFHDEIVVEWTPPSAMPSGSRGESSPLAPLLHKMKEVMSDAGQWTEFPLDADIKHAHRYIK
jgi:DNA polymerase